jgi:spoIIIJ-associated protein
MKFIEITGKNIDDAVENGLKELKLKADKVEVEVLEHGSKGLFGIGAKPAKVKLTVKHDYTTVANVFLTDILDKMGIKSEIHIKEEDDVIRVNLVGPDMGILIGYRGETLDALQYLLSLVINKENKENDYKKVILDTESYRKKREETLVRLAKRLADKVRKTGSKVELEPMNPYERRIIHSALQNYDDITTYSEGEEPFRKVIIDHK